jgi:hypothetical protein
VGRKKSWGSKGTTASQNIGPSVNKTVATWGYWSVHFSTSSSSQPTATRGWDRAWQVNSRWVGVLFHLLLLPAYGYQGVGKGVAGQQQVSRSTFSPPPPPRLRLPGAGQGVAGQQQVSSCTSPPPPPSLRLPGGGTGRGSSAAGE